MSYFDPFENINNAAARIDAAPAPIRTPIDEPIALPNALPPVALFDNSLLPEALRGWVSDIAERMQCPPDFPAVGAVVALSSLIGAKVVVAPKQYDDWRVVPNLWGVIVGRPGVMKSPALSEIMKPLNALEAKEREAWSEIHSDWKFDCEVAKLAAKTIEGKAKTLALTDKVGARELLKSQDEPPEPMMRRYIVNDATVEKLADILIANPWGTMVYRDEIHGLITGMDKNGQEGARGFYLTGYDGNQGHSVDRIMRGSSHVQRVCLSMLGGTQPSKAQAYVRSAVNGAAGDDGLLQRFSLTVWPDVTRDWRAVDKRPNAAARERAYGVFHRLNEMKPASENEPQVLNFTPAAQALYWDWAEQLEREIRQGALHPALESHLSKYRKLVPALALIFALVDTPDAGAIDTRELARALSWADYLRSHAERLYAAAIVPEMAGAETLLSKIKAGKLAGLEGCFTARQIAVKHWTGLTSPDAVRKACEILTEYGWLTREEKAPGSTGGRGSEIYHLHPSLSMGGLGL